MNDTVIEVKGISKTYRIWTSPAHRLLSPLQANASRLLPGAAGESLRARAASGYRDFHALKDIGFELRRGEAVGILGRNGSGKSTLLQIIAGTLRPTSGHVKTTGRIAALLELGSGFNPEFTGRENVLLMGAIMGIPREQMEAQFAAIAAFADIGPFIDDPVKTYSSGMMMRLAFAVQSAVSPDVLIVDEALSVGDAPFQAKCFARIRDIQSRGCAVLLVSHDVGTIRSFCQRALWLKEGIAIAQGSAADVCDAYNRDCMRAMGMRFEETGAAPATTVPATDGSQDSRLLAEDRTEFEKLAAGQRSGEGALQVRNFFFLNRAGARTPLLHWDEKITAVFVLGTQSGFEGLFQVGMVCKTLQGQELLCCSDRKHGMRIQLDPKQERVVTLDIQLPLRAGKYLVTVGAFIFPDDARFPTGTFDFSRSTVSDFITQAAVFEIAPQFNMGIYGPVQIESRLSCDGLPGCPPP